MRVVHVIKATRIGGAERHLLILLKALRERDVDARLLLLVEPATPMDDLVAEAQQRGIPVERVLIHGDADLLVTARLRDVLLRLKPDILHTHLIHADTFGLTAAKLAGLRHVISSRHNDDRFRAHPALRAASAVMWRTFSAGIAISEAIRRFTVEIEGAPPEKLTVIRYGIEFTPSTPQQIAQARAALRDELKLPPDTLLAGIACRLTEQKGVTYALQALASLHAALPDLHLVIAGDGPQRAALDMETDGLGIRGNVHFLGWRPDAAQLMAGLDVFLMPSLWEGFGLVALEAMTVRVPVIASDVSALPEVVAHGETGLLVPAQASAALAEAMRTLLTDRTLRAHMGMLAEDRVESVFSAARMAEETIALYSQFISTTGTVKRRVTIN